MATVFKHKGSCVTARLDGNEREVVRELLRQTKALVELVDGVTGDPVEDLMASIGKMADQQELTDRDPALVRLLPDGHHDDTEASAEFRSLTEHGLRQRKSANLSIASEALDDSDQGDELELDLGQAQALLIALTDVRLALGERLGLRTGDNDNDLQRDFAEVGDDVATDPRLLTALYYDFLTWMQESLTHALL